MNLKPAPSHLPKWLPGEARTSDRYASTTEVALRIGTDSPQLARVIDVSAEGLRVLKPANARTGKTVVAMLPGDGEHAGWVVWTDERECGIDFAEPLHADVLERVAQRLRDG